MSNSTDSEEWQRLYGCVRAVCSKHGKEDAFGNGDFWVVDDCWEGVGQKVVVSTPSFLTRRLVNDLSACIREQNLLGAEIVVALEIPGNAPAVGGSGLIVHSAGYTEVWDLAALRSKYGESFFT